MKKAFFLILTSIIVYSGVPWAGDSPKVIEIKVKKFEYIPKEIHLKKGEPVTLRFETLDRKHGFKVPALGLEAAIKPGEPTVINFTPQKTGTFNFHCSLFCGSGHEGMGGVIYVE
jgi:cytochrome c oxidase subunit 2